MINLKLSSEITLDMVRVTEAAALTGSLHLGRGDKNRVDQAAVDAMRGALDYLDIKGTVVIGEGEKDKAPMLYVGEEVGSWNENATEIDIAVDPIDGTRSVAYGKPNAISVIAAAERGKISSLPTFYSNKLAVGKELADKLDIDAPVRENLRIAAAALGIKVSELTVSILDRERHYDIIKEIRRVGARIRFVTEGDVASAIATALPESGIDIYMGIGGSPEGVLAAAALKCLGGEIQIKPWPRDEQDKDEMEARGVDFERVFFTDDLVRGDNVIFSATGVTDGSFLKGVRYRRNVAITESIVMRSISRTVRRITAYHDLEFKTVTTKTLGERKLIT